MHPVTLECGIITDIELPSAVVAVEMIAIIIPQGGEGFSLLVITIRTFISAALLFQIQPGDNYILRLTSDPFLQF